MQDQAEQEAATAQEILNKQNVNAREIQSMGEALYAQGKTSPEDLVQRYAQAHPDATPEQLAAIREAHPHMVEAATLDAQAGEQIGKQSNPYGNLLIAAYATQSVRAGSNGYAALLRSEEENKKLANELLSLLSGQRLDKKARDDGMIEMEQQRLEVAQLVLQLIDKNAISNSSRRSTLQG